MAQSQSVQSAQRYRAPIRGFTLVEVVTALSLLSIGTIALTGTFVGVTRAANSSERREVAILLAQRKMAEFRSAPLAQTGELSGGFAEPFEDYSWRAIVEPEREGRLLNIWLRVSYQSKTVTSTVSAMSSVLVAQP